MTIVMKRWKWSGETLSRLIMTAMRLVWLMVILGVWHGIASAELTVGLQSTPGGPRIAVNGTIVQPRMFWGATAFGSVSATSQWEDKSFDFIPAFEATATLHFRFGQTAGEIWLRGVRIIDLTTGEDMIPANSFSTSQGFSKFWNIFPPDARNTVGQVEILDSCLHVTLSDPPSGTTWPDFHLWSNLVTLKAQSRYRCLFQARSSPDRSITSTVYHVGSAWTPIGGFPGPFLREVALARDAGVPFITFGVQNCWVAPGQTPDWRPLDMVCQRILTVNPDALLVPRIGMDAPNWWLALHPEALMVYEGDSTGSKASISSRQYRTDAAAYLELLCRHLCETFPDNLAGVIPCGQNTGEWFYEGVWNNRLSGYDPATLQAWREYQSETAVVPSPDERRTSSHGLLLDPAQYSTQIRFNRFLQDEMADFILELAAAARRGTGGKKLIGFFYGYHYEFSTAWNSPAVGGHYGLSRIFQSSDVDFVCSPISYYDRQLSGTGSLMSSVESVISAGKLWFIEDDTRTYLNTNPVDHAKYGGLATQKETQSVLLRNTAQAILRGVGSWWMDHGAGTVGGWFDDPALWQVMSDLGPIDQALLDRPKRFEPEIAAIIDETSMLVMAGGTTLLGSNLIFQSRAFLGRSGAPYGQYRLEDALAGQIPAKLQIFLNAWALTPEQRTQLLQNRQSGVTRVWCYAPGYVMPDRFDPDAMTELTGFEFRKVNLSSAVVSPTPLGIAMGLKTQWGPARKVMPMFRVVAAEDEILANYTNQSAAVAFRRGDQGIDVFVGTPQLSSELIRVLAKLAGVHLYADQDAAIWAAEGYVSVHAVNDSPLVLYTPDSSIVRDAISGETIGIGPRIALSLKTGDTRLFKISSSTYIDGDHPAGDAVCRLDQNYPNPAGWTTDFHFYLSSGSPVRLVIYDVMGREAARPIDREYAAGSHAVRVDLKGLANGLYLCRFQAGRYIRYRKMMIIR